MGDAAGTARTRANLGMVAERQSAYARARALLKEALTLFRGLGARDDIAGTLAALGLVSEFQGDDDTAWSLLEEGLALFRTLGDAWGSANTQGNMAITVRRHGRYDRALTPYVGGVRSRHRVTRARDRMPLSFNDRASPSNDALSSAL
jgi:hypothetical protein